MYLWYKEVIELNTYRTTEVATAIGIHPNTVRLYEELGLIPTPERESNGYRIFTEFHIQLMRKKQSKLYKIFFRVRLRNIVSL